MSDSYGEHLLEYCKVSCCVRSDLWDTNLARPEISSNECTGIKDHILGRHWYSAEIYLVFKKWIRFS
jgi:hypothetical protein